ncbi:MAG: FadR/GntR family transcriptional regulator [Myxococcota bacterium]
MDPKPERPVGGRRSGEANDAVRKAVPDLIAERIQARILDGSFRPGDRLPPERELAGQLCVNRSSLREALKKLEQLRLITIQQGSGIRVRSPEEASFDVVWSMLFVGGQPNLTRIREFLELREALLPRILRLGLERAGQEEIDHALVVIERASDPALSDERFAAVLLELSDGLCRMAGNQILVMLANSLRHFMAQRGFRPALRVLVHHRSTIVSLLHRLAPALRSRDMDGAESTYSAFLRLSAREILGELERTGAA